MRFKFVVSRFDQALYGDIVVRQEALAVAFAPVQVREGSTTYGFGWNIAREAAGLRVRHQGNTAGSERSLNDACGIEPR